jgi:hypothetical protein
MHCACCVFSLESQRPRRHANIGQHAALDRHHPSQCIDFLTTASVSAASAAEAIWANVDAVQKAADWIMDFFKGFLQGGIAAQTWQGVRHQIESGWGRVGDAGVAAAAKRLG